MTSAPRLDLTIREEIRGIRFSLEPLNWTVSRPGRALFRAPLANVPIPTSRSTSSCRTSRSRPATEIDSAFVPDTGRTSETGTARTA